MSIWFHLTSRRDPSPVSALGTVSLNMHFQPTSNRNGKLVSYRSRGVGVWFFCPLDWNWLKGLAKFWSPGRAPTGTARFLGWNTRSREFMSKWMILALFCTLLAHVVDVLLILVANLAHVVDRADSGQARGIVIKENVGKMSLVVVQIRGRKCIVAFTYKTTFSSLFGTCSRHSDHFDALGHILDVYMISPDLWTRFKSCFGSWYRLVKYALSTQIGKKC